ncbi:hypothetical protein [Peribacillus butanolivorans]|uniref:hypothetical protein n=1 Tax=Peribacillus butanolivorans TaxID=421767 RepID=UPI0039FC883C
MKIEFAYSFFMISRICPLQVLLSAGGPGAFSALFAPAGSPLDALLFFEFVELMGMVILNPFTEVIFTNFLKTKLGYTP